MNKFIKQLKINFNIINKFIQQRKNKISNDK